MDRPPTDSSPPADEPGEATKSPAPRPASAHSTAPSTPITRVTESDLRRFNRRELLKLSPVILAGAFAIKGLREPLLAAGLRLSDWASGKYFRKSRLAPTFSSSDVVALENFPYNGYDVIDPGVDLEKWTLSVEGLVRKPGRYSLAQIRSLPKVEQNVRHICVEGWDAIGSFGGARAGEFLDLVGADRTASFLEVECADDYYESYDMDSVLQPQTLLCYEMYGIPLNRGHGAPLRLNMPTKLGYKQAKYLVRLRVTNVLRPEKRGYWEDQGYSWFAGI